MARNVEIKARIHSVAQLEPRVAALADAGPTAIAQADTFFHCAQGRLKLRVFGDGSAELIAYERGDADGPALSDYVRAPVAEPAALRSALARACGLRGRVVKQRTLYKVGQARVHLDVVEGLGDFLEVEVVLADGESVADGEALARRLLSGLGIAPAQWLAPAYIDLLEQCPAPPPGA